MGDNIVLNNSAHNFSTHDLGLVEEANQTKVVATPGTAEAVRDSLRSQLEAGTLASHGLGAFTDNAS